MAVGAQTGTWAGASRRRVPRFPMREVVDITALRAGVPDTIPGRAVNVCERGIAAVLAQELVPGEAVAVEVQLPSSRVPLRTKAIVRYQDRLRSGLEFVDLSAEQRETIRSWAKQAKPTGQMSTTPKVTVATTRTEGPGRLRAGGTAPRRRKSRHAILWTSLVLIAAFVAGVFWWRWTRGWQDLEAGLKTPGSISSEQPKARVPAEVMEKLLVHRVEPVYPAEARKANLQGIIAVEIVVSGGGSVVSMHALNGPEVLARAAMDALRWWKFEPYRVNGEPATVETTVAVEFKR